MTSIKGKGKCRDYPHCKRPRCMYIHPTVKCRFYPKCKKGDTCTFVHESSSIVSHKQPSVSLSVKDDKWTIKTPILFRRIGFTYKQTDSAIRAQQKPIYYDIIHCYTTGGVVSTVITPEGLTLPSAVADLKQYVSKEVIDLPSEYSGGYWQPTAKHVKIDTTIWFTPRIAAFKILESILIDDLIKIIDLYCSIDVVQSTHYKVCERGGISGG
jgi:hypothetical protein